MDWLTVLSATYLLFLVSGLAIQSANWGEDCIQGQRCPLPRTIFLKLGSEQDPAPRNEKCWIRIQQNDPRNEKCQIRIQHNDADPPPATPWLNGPLAIFKFYQFSTQIYGRNDVSRGSPFLLSIFPPKSGLSTVRKKQNYLSQILFTMETDFIKLLQKTAYMKFSLLKL